MSESQIAPEPNPRRELWTFLLILAAYLAPIWAFTYVPTQDGPSHLSNATILRQFNLETARYRDYYELHFEVLPNWTSHLILFGLLSAVEPTTAEKILASLYLIGFAFSIRHYLGAFGHETRRLAPLGLLFAYNRCFLMGFFNYCFALSIFFFVLGEGLRRREHFGPRAVAGLSLLLVATFFTHLLGFLLALAGAIWIAAFSPRRWRNLALIGLAALPSLLFTSTYLVRSGFFGGERGAIQEITRSWQQEHHYDLDAFWEMITSLNNQLFAFYEHPSFSFGLTVFFAAEGVFLLGLLHRPGRPGRVGPPRWPMAVLALGFAALYVVLPEHLGEHGGFIPARIAPLPLLLGLGCLSPPKTRPARGLAAIVAALALAINLGLVIRYFAQANRDLAEFVSGTDVVGRQGKTIATLRKRPPPTQLVNHLEHASDYYCVNTLNINFDNYEAATGHFPIRFRQGLPKRQDGLADPIRLSADVLLVWDIDPGTVPTLNDGQYREIAHRGRLRVYERATPDGGPKAGEEAAVGQLQGVWRLESVTVNGKKQEGADLDKFRRMTLTIDKNRAVQADDDAPIATYEMTFDASKDPRTFDAKAVEGFGKGEVYKGIWKVEGDTLLWCFSPKDRPKGFESKDDTDVTLIIHKRQKPK